MKTISILAAALVLALVAGCATTFKPWKLSEVQEGMPREELVEILGEPDHTVTKNGAEYLYYTYREELPPVSDASLETRENIDRRVAELDRTMKEYKYEVMLVDGSVVNYKEKLD